MKISCQQFMVVSLLLLSQAILATDANPHGPNTEPVVLAAYTKIFYVDATKGAESNAGSKASPYKSLSVALKNAGNTTQTPTAILVAAGTYAEATLVMKSGVDLFGGFSSGTWERDVQKHPTTLSGNGEHQILIGASDAKLDGFIVSNGTIRGNGGAIVCRGTSPTITNNVFRNNKSLKPENWNPNFLHLTANDGGAVYGDSGAAPVIKNNLFVSNKTENGRGAAIAFNSKCKPVIESKCFY